MFWLLLAAAQAAPPPQKSKSFVTYDNYPAEALRNHWEGVVVADLTISPEGRVAACKVIQSSGHQVLDDATCDLMIRRAIFTPARDSNGKPVEDHVRTPPITWSLPN